MHKASEYSQTAEQEVLTQFREENDEAGDGESPEHLVCAPPARGGFSSVSVPLVSFAVSSTQSL